MKIFNINKLQFVLAGICGGFLLTGCVGEGSSEDSKSKNNTTAAKTVQNLQDVNDENHLWAVITGSDSNGYEPDLRFAINNGSGSDIKFFGCDGNVRQFSTQFESIIPAGYKTGVKAVSESDPKKNKLDPMNYGLYLPESLQKYQFKFGEDAYHGDNTKEQCYFGIYDSSQGEYMYFKMVNDVRQFNTYSAIFNDMERPYRDAKKWAARFDEVLASRAPSIDDNLTAVFGAWAAIGKAVDKPPAEVSAAWIDNQSSKLYDMAARQWNLNREIYIEATKAGKTVEAEAALNNLLQFFNKNQTVFDLPHATLEEKINVIKNFRLIRSGEPFVNGSRFPLSLMDNDYKVFSMHRGHPDPNFNWEKYGLERLKGIGNIEGFYTENWKYLVEHSIELNQVAPDSFPKLRYIQDLFADRFEVYEKNRNVFTDVARAAGPDGAKVIEEISTTGKYMKTSRMALTAAKAIPDVLLLVVDWFLIQPMTEWIYNEPGFGTFDTGIAQLSVEEITTEDANNWNKNHPNAKIYANTDVLNDLDNNSIISTTQFKFKKNEQKGLDTNTTYSLNIAKVSTPWLRIDGSSNDPFLGDVGKSVSGNHKGSSVFKMSFNISRRVAIDDFDSTFNQLYFGSLGLSQLSERAKGLPAPTVTIANNSVQNSGKLQANKDGLQTFGALSGIFINSQKSARLNVVIPSTKVGNDTLSGTAFSADFVEEDDSSALPGIVRSTQLFTQLQNSEMPIVLTRFNCDANLKTGTTCPMEFAVNKGSNSRFKGKLFVADENSKSTSVPVYVNYNLITEPQMFSVEQYSTGTYRIFMHNTTNSKYAKVEVTGLPAGTTVVADGCSAGLAAGADCNIDYKFNQVNKDGTYNVKIKAYPSDGSTPKAFDTSDLLVQINDSW